MEFDLDIAKKIYNQYNSNKNKYKKMYDYYIGNTDVLRNYPTTDRSNSKIVDNFIKAFIDEEVSFMTGVPVTYSVKNGGNDVIDDIEYNLNNVSYNIDTELATNLLIFGEAYELYYINEDEFKIKCFNPMNSYAYRDTEGKVQLFMYFYKKELDDTNVYAEVIDDNFIYHMDENFKELEPATPHYFETVPVGVAILPNKSNDTLYNNIKYLQDAYESTMSDWSNEIADTRLAYLYLTGVDIDEETASKMKQMGIIQSSDSNSKAEWLIKNIDSNFIKEYRSIIKEDIYRVAQHVDNQVNVQSNTSGVMLATRLNCLRIKITTQNQSMKNCIKTRLKCLFRYLDIAENKVYDYRMINIKPQLNLPQNDVETAQIISQLNGKLSIQTGLERLSFITNGKAEFEKMLEEQKLMEQNSMASLDDIDTDTDDIDADIDTGDMNE